MSYVMGFVTPIPTDRREAFVRHAAKAAELFLTMGATRVVDGWGDDVKKGKVNDFFGAVAAEDGETVGFGWMEFPDQATADRCSEQMRTDPRMQDLGEMPFDGRRMIFGGFEPILDAGASGVGRAGYVDGFLGSVKPENKEAYRAMAGKVAPLFLEHGVLRLVEAWGVDVPHGKLTDFYRAAHAPEGEVPIFSWCEWPDRATRDKGMAALMADPRMQERPAEMPFDGMRMVFGGFDVVSDR